MADIRSFFGKPKSNPVSVSKPTSQSTNKKKRLVISDSSDDDVIDLSKTQNKKRKTGSPAKKPPLDIRTKQNTAPTDFFGSSKVKKVKKENKPIVKKPLPESKPKRKIEICDFSDEELFEDPSFMETLDKLDNDEKKQKLKQENVTPKEGTSVSSLSEKLAQKKGMSWKDKVGFANGQTDMVTAIVPSKEKTPISSKKRPRESDESVHASPVNKTPIRKTGSDLNTPTPTKTKIETPNTETSNTETPKTETPKGKAGYWAYKNRAGPKNPGSKEIPIGAENCLEGCTFVLSGVYESLERDEAASLIARYGGRVTGAVSRKTTFLVVGEECGVKKLDQAEKLKVKKIDEDGLLELVRTRPGKKSSYDIKVEKEHTDSEAKKTKEKKMSELKAANETKKSVVEKKESNTMIGVKMEKSSVSTLVKTKVEHSSSKADKIPVCKPNADHSALGSDPWTEKYRPTKVKDIIGQQGDKSNVKKLLNWLKNWSSWHKIGGKAPFSKDTGSHCKAALLSGAPGVGKTTSATVCCKELGFTYIEMNASDTRSKKSLKEHVSNLLNNHTINGIMTKGARADKHVLIMDEVDGMAGNEDRGGMAELIQLIKTSRIPIICICNDRNAQKIRSLSNYCFDLRFYKPRLEQVKGAMMSIAFKEGLRIPPPAMQKIIEGANNDIRQTLNNICLWSAGTKSLNFDQASSEASKARKDMNMSVFDIPRLFFSCGEETRKYTYTDYSDLFFQDYSMTPFFIHENYPRSRPASHPSNDTIKTLKCVSNAADSICFGDTVGTAIKMENWSLLPTQAHYSAIMPGFYMRGGLSGMVEFPKVLGQTSRINKYDNILQDLLGHMILNVNTDKRQLGMEYLPLLKNKLLTPLIQRENEGVGDVVDMMNCYDLQREDWDNIMELSTFSPLPNPATSVKSTVKSAFTRQFNKDSHTTPYALESAATKKRKTKAKLEDGEEEEVESGEEDDGDAMIKPKAKTAPKKKQPAKSRSGKSAGEPSKKRVMKPKK